MPKLTIQIVLCIFNSWVISGYQQLTASHIDIALDYCKWNNMVEVNDSTHISFDLTLTWLSYDWFRHILDIYDNGLIFDLRFAPKTTSAAPYIEMNTFSCRTPSGHLPFRYYQSDLNVLKHWDIWFNQTNIAVWIDREPVVDTKASDCATPHTTHTSATLCFSKGRWETSRYSFIETFIYETSDFITKPYTPTFSPTLAPSRVPSMPTTNYPSRAPSTTPTQRSTAPSHAPTETKTSCGTRTWCYYSDLFPTPGIVTSQTINIQNPDDAQATNFNIYITIQGSHCIEPTITFTFEEIDFSSSNEYLDVFDNDGSKVDRCSGTLDSNCGNWMTCFTDRNLKASQISRGDTYMIRVYEPSSIDDLCSHDLSINANLTFTCSGNTASPTSLTSAPTERPSTTPTQRSTAPSHAPTETKTSCGTRTWCYYSDLFPIPGIVTAQTINIQNPDDEQATNFKIYITIQGSHCIEPTITFTFEEIDFQMSTEYLDVFDNDGSKVDRCSGTRDSNCGNWMTCFADRNLKASQISRGDTYMIRVYESIAIDSLCSHDLSINANLTFTCSDKTASTSAPTESPTSPTYHPTKDPTGDPTIDPTSGPTTVPTFAPTSGPSRFPSNAPSAAPSINPTNYPSNAPSMVPSTAPTTNPTLHPTIAPSSAPSIAPSLSPIYPPSNAPTNAPSIPPSQSPSIAPSASPSLAPSIAPSIVPSRSPSSSPSVAPTASPTNIPSSVPSINPTLTPSSAPTAAPSLTPSETPTIAPTTAPSSIPTKNPSVNPSLTPTRNPTNNPSLSPTATPSLTPTLLPSTAPSLNPTNDPTITPTIAPSLNPTETPSVNPSLVPTRNPTNHPSLSPTATPSLTPTLLPSTAPSLNPTNDPTITPTIAPSLNPTETPSVNPSLVPTRNPTNHPSLSPTATPSLAPTLNPTLLPSTAPSLNPTNNPTFSPSQYPTKDPTQYPTYNPSMSPTLYPTSIPTNAPSASPSIVPSISPTLAPSSNPSIAPSIAPSDTPSVSPTNGPSFSPSMTPTANPVYNKDYEYLTCLNLDQSMQLLYDVTQYECIIYCLYESPGCRMINHYSYFRMQSDSRCYLYDKPCAISSDISSTNRQSSTVWISETLDSDGDCINFPPKWKDKVGDTCDMYEQFGLCANNTLIPSDMTYTNTNATEACCQCSEHAGLHSADNVNYLYQHKWPMVIDDAQSECMLEHNTNPNDIQYDNYDNLVLMEWCNKLQSKFDIKIPCHVLIDHSLTAHTIDLYLCDYLDFMFLYAMNTIFINMHWFELYTDVLPSSVRVQTMSFGSCIETINDLEELHQIYGIYPCSLVNDSILQMPSSTLAIATVMSTTDVIESEESSFVSPLIMLYIIIGALGFCVLMLLFLFCILFAKKKRHQHDKGTAPHIYADIPQDAPHNDNKDEHQGEEGMELMQERDDNKAVQIETDYNKALEMCDVFETLGSRHAFGEESRELEIGDDINIDTQFDALDDPFESAHCMVRNINELELDGFGETEDTQEIHDINDNVKAEHKSLSVGPGFVIDSDLIKLGNADDSAFVNSFEMGYDPECSVLSVLDNLENNDDSLQPNTHESASDRLAETEDIDRILYDRILAHAKHLQLNSMINIAMHEDLSQLTHNPDPLDPSSNSEQHSNTTEIDKTLIKQVHIELELAANEKDEKYNDEINHNKQRNDDEEDMQHKSLKKQENVNASECDNAFAIEMQADSIVKNIHVMAEDEEQNQQTPPPFEVCPVWDAYIKQYGFPPQSVSHLLSFSKYSPDMTMLTYVNAREIFNRRKNNGIDKIYKD
eukprot:318588_1